MICDQCGNETNVLNYAVNHVDEMDLCADCFSQVPEENRVGYKTPTHLEVRAFATHDYDGVMRVSVGSVVRDRDEQATRYDFTESEESREQRENPGAISASDVAELYNEGVGAPMTSPAPTNTQFESQLRQSISMIGDLSFGAPSNDLGARVDSGTSRYPFVIIPLDPRRRSIIKRQFNAQRQQLAAKDAIIEQLRERLDRAKRRI